MVGMYDFYDAKFINNPGGLHILKLYHKWTNIYYN